MQQAATSFLRLVGAIPRAAGSNTMKNILALSIALAALAACGRESTTSRDTYDADRTRTSPADADNTARNVRDKDGAMPTPADQGGTEADRNRTAEIRKRVTDTDTLSADAKNVKIITVNGRVTLRGPVKTAAEKGTIVRIASEVAGEANVDDQLEVDVK
jgi:hypothetical protein